MIVRRRRSIWRESVNSPLRHQGRLLGMSTRRRPCISLRSSLSRSSCFPPFFLLSVCQGIFSGRRQYWCFVFTTVSGTVYYGEWFSPLLDRSSISHAGYPLTRRSRLRPIPFVSAKDFYTSFSCFASGAQGWSSLGRLRVSSSSPLRVASRSLSTRSSLSLPTPGFVHATVC